VEQPLIVAQLAIQLVIHALEHFTLNAQLVIHQLLFWLMEMNAGEYALELIIGNPQTILASLVFLLVLPALEQEQVSATVVYQEDT
jgi:hypothetical protein